MSKISEMTRESWIESTFPEWGTWLVEDIENEVVAPGNVAMWWLGCTGVWFKTPADTNITIDLWCGNGKRTHGDGKMKVGHQMANMCGARMMQPNLRAIPFVIDPFEIKKVDAVLATHYHQDHMSAEYASHVIKSGMTTVDENGKERVTEQKSYYLGNRCVAGTLGNDEIVYNKSFAESEIDKQKAINDLIDKISEKEIEKNSMNKLKNEEMREILTEYLGRKITEEELPSLLEKMNNQEIEEVQGKIHLHSRYKAKNLDKGHLLS